MKRMILSFALLSAVMFAGSVTVVSATGQSNQYNANGPNVTPGSYGINWSTASTVDASAEWVSDGYVGSRANGTTLTYTQMVYVTGTPTSNAIKAMCADTCLIKVNGTTVQNYDTSFTEYYGCGDSAGCRFNTLVNLSNVSGFVNGWNTVTFTTKKTMQTAPQGASTYSGVVYKITVGFTCGC